MRTLVTLGVLVLAIFGTLFAGTRLSDATWMPNLALDLEGGTQIILRPVATDEGKITSETISQAIEVIRQRVDASGVSEAEITSQGSGASSNIVVALPGKPDEATLELVRRSAQMEFRPVLAVSYGTPTSSATASATPSAGATADAATDGSTDTATDAATPEPSASATPSDEPTKDAPDSPSDTEYYVTAAVQAEFDALDCSDQSNLTGGRVGASDKAFVTCDQSGAYKYILGPVEVEGARIASASSGLETLSNGSVGTKWVVNLKFDSLGTTQFAATSTRLYSETSPLNQFGIVLDGLVISAPSMNGVIANGEAQISGSFTRQSAATLANQLNFGSLPLTFEVQSEQQISATLGSEQLQKGLLAGLIGLVLVVVYSLAQYRLLGLVTVGSLVMAAVLTYGSIALLSWLQGYRLSLPGVAGLIVAIGITADSFIVYFERVRDELREGRTLVAAVDRGWLRARRTILASDAVNFIAAIVLYVLAVGGVRGFAFTLGLTTIIDLVVVFVFTHPTLTLLARTHFFGEGHPLSGLDPRRLGVPGARYVGRGKIAAAGEPAGGRVVEAATSGLVATAPGMTIAERRAAERAAAVQDEPVDSPEPDGPEPDEADDSATTEGSER